MDNKKTRFLPFHAINEFMRQDHRSSVVRVVLNNLADLPVDLRNSLERTINKSIQVPGFRNPGKAPAALKIKPTIESFEKKASLVAAILSAWTALHFELAHQIYDLLSQRNWEVLPLDADRTKLPGFSIKWPPSAGWSRWWACWISASSS